MPATFNNGDFKRFLATGDGYAQTDVPQGLGRVVNSPASAEDATPPLSPKVAKTILKKTLAQHDKAYHPDGYKEGDECNFRAELTEKDKADELKSLAAGGEERFGLVKFEESNGKKKVTDIVDVTEVVGEQEDAQDSIKAERYLQAAGCGAAK